ncbi:MAG: hypothetical protein ACRDRO_21490 [Pseudonocardiaceae bacterium]
MGTKRPYKVTFHYDPSPSRASAIDATQSSHELCSARRVAREVSRRGGHASVWTRDPLTGEECTLRRYQPLEVALEDLLQEQIDDLMYGGR